MSRINYTESQFLLRQAVCFCKRHSLPPSNLKFLCTVIAVGEKFLLKVILTSREEEMDVRHGCGAVIMTSFSQRGQQVSISTSGHILQDDGIETPA